MTEIQISLDAKSREENPVQGVNRRDTVSWSSNNINGKVEVRFFRFEPVNHHPFQDPPKLRDNVVAGDAARGRYFYTVLSNGVEVGGGTVIIPDPPDG